MVARMQIYPKFACNQVAGNYVVGKLIEVTPPVV